MNEDEPIKARHLAIIVDVFAEVPADMETRYVPGWVREEVLCRAPFAGAVADFAEVLSKLSIRCGR